MQEIQFKTLQSAYNLDLAQISVCTSEIENFLIRHSLTLVETEHAALAKCFEMNSRDLEYHIHPFQQFAAVPNDLKDRLQHLDPINKISALQWFLT